MSELEELRAYKAAMEARIATIKEATRQQSAEEKQHLNPSPADTRTDCGRLLRSSRRSRFAFAQIRRNGLILIMSASRLVTAA